MGDLRVTISQDEKDEYDNLKNAAQRESWLPSTAALREIGASYAGARMKHKPMRGPHEGYAILLEEVDELWDEVKRWQPTDVLEGGDFYKNAAMRKEALHVAAMALAFIIEVCDASR